MPPSGNFDYVGLPIEVGQGNDITTSPSPLNNANL